MADNIVNRIFEEYNTLTKSQRKIADFVLTHKDDTQYMTISDLAAACRVAESTLTYFCKALGCTGFNDFKLSMAKGSAPAAEAAETSEISTDVLPEDSIGEMCQKLFAANQDSLAQTLAMIEPEKVRAAVNLLLHAEQVFCYGQGVSSILAMEAWGRFATITSKFHWVQDSHMQVMTTSLLNKRSVILYFSFSGETRDLMENAKEAKKLAVPIILVTRFAKCPASPFASVTLLCGCNESPLNSGSIAAKISQLFLVDILYNEYYRSDTCRFAKEKDKTSSVIAKKLL